MFPFSQNLDDYHKMTEAEARVTLSGVYPRGIVFTLERKVLPAPLQRIPTFVQGFVSGVTNPSALLLASGEPSHVVFTVRYDAKDAPKTGNLNAYLLIKLEDRVLMSPPCSELGDLPHHFSGQCPISGVFKRHT
jgi:hypothetical protein